VDDETFERIPWEQLSTKPASSGVSMRSLGYLIAGAIAVAGLTAALVSGRGEVEPPTTTMTPTTVPLVSTSVASTTLVSEESLQAFPHAESEAAAWAEWVTEKYLSADGTGSSDLATLLPPGSALPVPAAGQRVFVESARAIAIATDAADHRITVLARLLGASGSEPYRRIADRALVWTLRWAPEGWMVRDLPEEVSPPRLLAGPAQATGPVPEPILTEASKLGSVMGGAMEGDLWRVVITIADSLGGTWPVVAWFSPDGSRVPS
jgi:hypothetical protein